MIKNQLFVVRHGESENNQLKIECAKIENKEKFGLTEQGIKQTEEQAKRYSEFNLVITSPLRRAKETAMIFANTSQCELVEDELLREVDLGDFELRPYRETDKFFDSHKNESIPFPNGESLADAKTRTNNFLHAVNSTYSNKNILIVTHGHIALFLMELTNPDFNRQEAIESYVDKQSRTVVKLG